MYLVISSSSFQVWLPSFQLSYKDKPFLGHIFLHSPLHNSCKAMSKTSTQRSSHSLNPLVQSLYFLCSLCLWCTTLHKRPPHQCCLKPLHRKVANLGTKMTHSLPSGPCSAATSSQWSSLICLPSWRKLHFSFSILTIP